MANKKGSDLGFFVFVIGGLAALIAVVVATDKKS